MQVDFVLGKEDVLHVVVAAAAVAAALVGRDGGRRVTFAVPPSVADTRRVNGAGWAAANEPADGATDGVTDGFGATQDSVGLVPDRLKTGPMRLQDPRQKSARIHLDHNFDLEAFEDDYLAFGRLAAAVNYQIRSFLCLLKYSFYITCGLEQIQMFSEPIQEAGLVIRPGYSDMGLYTPIKTLFRKVDTMTHTQYLFLFSVKRK